MFHPDEYISSLTRLLRTAFGERLIYVGLQGSYLRGEATESSDIDVMVVIDSMSAADLAAYRQAIASLPDADKSCGFICGRDELLHWNPLEICHLLHTTQDCFGTLKKLVPAYTQRDVRTYVQLSVGNLYHEVCHRRIHASREDEETALPMTYKAVFYILQNLHYLDAGEFLPTKEELLAALSGLDRQVLETAVAIRNGGVDHEAAFALLFAWCGETLARISYHAGDAL